MKALFLLAILLASALASTGCIITNGDGKQVECYFTDFAMTHSVCVPYHK